MNCRNKSPIKESYLRIVIGTIKCLRASTGHTPGLPYNERLVDEKKEQKRLRSVILPVFMAPPYDRIHWEKN